MDYPAALLPLAAELVVLPRGDTARISRCSLIFKPWKNVPERGHGPDRRLVMDRTGRKRPVEELIIRKCEREGWSGIYFEEFGNRMLASSGVPAEVPEVHAALLNRVFSVNVSRLGCFNFFLWKGEGRIFGYATRSSHRKIRTPQLRWITSLLDSGVPSESLVIVEWGTPGGRD